MAGNVYYEMPGESRDAPLHQDYCSLSGATLSLRTTESDSQDFFACPIAEDDAPPPFSVTIPRAEIVNDGIWMSHMCYLVQVSDMGLIRTVRRRFSDFQRLARKLDRLLSDPKAHMLCASVPSSSQSSLRPQSLFTSLSACNTFASTSENINDSSMSSSSESPGIILDNGRERVSTVNIVTGPVESPRELPPNLHSPNAGTSLPVTDHFSPSKNASTLHQRVQSQVRGIPSVVNSLSASVSGTTEAQETPIQRKVLTECHSGGGRPGVILCGGNCAVKSTVVSMLPVKKMFGNMDPAFVEERRCKLERLLRQLLLREEILLLPPLWSFFGLERDAAAIVFARFFVVTNRIRRKQTSCEGTIFHAMDESLKDLGFIACTAVAQDHELSQRSRCGRIHFPELFPSSSSRSQIYEVKLFTDIVTLSSPYTPSPPFLLPLPFRLCGRSPISDDAPLSSSVQSSTFYTPQASFSSSRSSTARRHHLLFPSSSFPSSGPPSSYSSSSSEPFPSTTSVVSPSYNTPFSSPSSPCHSLWRLYHPQVIVRLVSLISDVQYVPSALHLQVLHLLDLLLALSPPHSIPLLRHTQAFERVFRLLEYSSLAALEEAEGMKARRKRRGEKRRQSTKTHRHGRHVYSGQHQGTDGRVRSDFSSCSSSFSSHTAACGKNVDEKAKSSSAFKGCCLSCPHSPRRFHRRPRSSRRSVYVHSPSISQHITQWSHMHFSDRALTSFSSSSEEKEEENSVDFSVRPHQKGEVTNGSRALQEDGQDRRQKMIRVSQPLNVGEERGANHITTSLSCTPSHERCIKMKKKKEGDMTDERHLSSDSSAAIQHRQVESRKNEDSRGRSPFLPLSHSPLLRIDVSSAWQSSRSRLLLDIVDECMRLCGRLISLAPEELLTFFKSQDGFVRLRSLVLLKRGMTRGDGIVWKDRGASKAHERKERRGTERLEREGTRGRRSSRCCTHSDGEERGREPRSLGDTREIETGGRAGRVMEEEEKRVPMREDDLERERFSSCGRNTNRQRRIDDGGVTVLSRSTTEQDNKEERRTTRREAIESSTEGDEDDSEGTCTESTSSDPDNITTSSEGNTDGGEETGEKTTRDSKGREENKEREEETGWTSLQRRAKRCMLLAMVPVSNLSCSSTAEMSFSEAVMRRTWKKKTNLLVDRRKHPILQGHARKPSGVHTPQITGGHQHRSISFSDIKRQGWDGSGNCDYSTDSDERSLSEGVDKLPLSLKERREEGEQPQGKERRSCGQQDSVSHEKEGGAEASLSSCVLKIMTSRPFKEGGDVSIGEEKLMKKNEEEKEGEQQNEEDAEGAKVDTEGQYVVDDSTEGLEDSVRGILKGNIQSFVALLLWSALPLVGLEQALTSQHSLGMELLAQLYSSRHSTIASIVCALILSSLIRSGHFSSSSSLSSPSTLVSSSAVCAPPTSFSSLSPKPHLHSTSPVRRFPFSSSLLSPTCRSALQVAGSSYPSSHDSSASILLSSSIPLQPILSSSSSSTGVVVSTSSRGGMSYVRPCMVGEVQEEREKIEEEKNRRDVEKEGNKSIRAIQAAEAVGALPLLLALRALKKPSEAQLPNRGIPLVLLHHLLTPELAPRFFRPLFTLSSDSSSSSSSSSVGPSPSSIKGSLRDRFGQAQVSSRPLNTEETTQTQRPSIAPLNLRRVEEQGAPTEKGLYHNEPSPSLPSSSSSFLSSLSPQVTERHPHHADIQAFRDKPLSASEPCRQGERDTGRREEDEIGQGRDAFHEDENPTGGCCIEEMEVSFFLCWLLALFVTQGNPLYLQVYRREEDQQYWNLLIASRKTRRGSLPVSSSGLHKKNREYQGGLEFMGASTEGGHSCNLSSLGSPLSLPFHLYRHPGLVDKSPRRERDRRSHSCSPPLFTFPNSSPHCSSSPSSSPCISITQVPQAVREGEPHCEITNGEKKKTRGPVPSLRFLNKSFSASSLDGELPPKKVDHRERSSRQIMFHAATGLPCFSVSSLPRPQLSPFSFSSLPSLYSSSSSSSSSTSLHLSSSSFSPPLSSHLVPSLHQAGRNAHLSNEREGDCTGKKSEKQESGGSEKDLPPPHFHSEEKSTYLSKASLRRKKDGEGEDAPLQKERGDGAMSRDFLLATTPSWPSKREKKRSQSLHSSDQGLYITRNLLLQSGLVCALVSQLRHNPSLPVRRLAALVLLWSPGWWDDAQLASMERREREGNENRGRHLERSREELAMECNRGDKETDSTTHDDLIGKGREGEDNVKIKSQGEGRDGNKRQVIEEEEGVRGEQGGGDEEDRGSGREIDEGTVERRERAAQKRSEVLSRFDKSDLAQESKYEGIDDGMLDRDNDGLKSKIVYEKQRSFLETKGKEVEINSTNTHVNASTLPSLSLPPSSSLPPFPVPSSPDDSFLPSSSSSLQQLHPIHPSPNQCACPIPAVSLLSPPSSEKEEKPSFSLTGSSLSPFSSFSSSRLPLVVSVRVSAIVLLLQQTKEEAAHQRQRLRKEQEKLKRRQELVASRRGLLRSWRPCLQKEKLFHRPSSSSSFSLLHKRDEREKFCCANHSSAQQEEGTERRIQEGDGEERREGKEEEEERLRNESTSSPSVPYGSGVGSRGFHRADEVSLSSSCFQTSTDSLLSCPPLSQPQEESRLSWGEEYEGGSCEIKEVGGLERRIHDAHSSIFHSSTSTSSPSLDPSSSSLSQRLQQANSSSPLSLRCSSSFSSSFHPHTSRERDKETSISCSPLRGEKEIIMSNGMIAPPKSMDFSGAILSSPRPMGEEEAEREQEETEERRKEEKICVGNNGEGKHAVLKGEMPTCSREDVCFHVSSSQESSLHREKRDRYHNYHERRTHRRRGEQEIKRFLQRLQYLRRTRKVMKRKMVQAVSFLTQIRGKLESLLLRASTVEHLLSAEISPRFSFLSALEDRHRLLTRALNEATVAVSLATASAERQRRQLLASQRMLRNCMQRASAAKRQAVCSRNKWMEVEQLIAAAPQRRQQLEEQLAYRMRVLTRLQEKSTHQQMLLQQLRLEEQQRRERRQQEEVDARQIAAALEVFTAALRRRRHPPFTRLSSADIPSSSSLSVDLSNPSVSLPVASSSLASSVDSSGEWPALRPFVRLLPARLQHRPEILSLLSVSERKDEKRQEGGDEERDSYRSSKKEREKNISLRGNVSAPPLPPVSSSQGDQASLDMKEKEKSKENHVDKSHEQEGGFSRETKDTDEGLDIRMRFEVFLRRLLIEQQERAKRSHEGEGRRRRRGRGGEEDERRRRRRTTSGHGHSSHHNDHSKMKTSYGRSSTGLDKTKEDEEEEDEYDEDEEEEEEEEDGEIRVLEKQVYEVMKETEQHEAQVHQLERMIKEQTDRQTLLKKAEELQNEVRQCDSEVSLLISQEHSARRRYTREQEEAEKYEKLLTSREEERKVAKIALESQIQTLRQEEDLARKLLYQGEEELRGIWVLLQQIEKELRYVGLRRFYVDESLQEEQEDRQRLRDQVCRSLTALNDLRSTLDAIQDDDAIHTLSLSKRKKKKL